MGTIATIRTAIEAIEDALDDLQHCPQPNCPIHIVDVEALDGDG